MAEVASIVVTADDGCTLHVEQDGAGPPLVLVSGLGGRASFWNAVRPLLREQFRLVLFDHRGTGASGHPQDSYTIDRLARDIVAILDALDVPRAHVAGHSTGGAVAQALGRGHAGRVDRLVMSGTWARADARFRLLFETRLKVLLEAGSATHATLGQLLGFPPAWINDNEGAVAAAVAAAQADEDQATAAARIRMILEHDFLDQLGSITAPTLVLGAPDDAVVPIEHARQIAERIPHAAYAEIKGGHFFPVTAADNFAATVRSFLLENRRG